MNNQIEPLKASGLEFDEKIYQIIRKRTTWNEARVDAERLGGQLAIVTGDEHLEALNDHFGGDSKRFWVGVCKSFNRLDDT